MNPKTKRKELVEKPKYELLASHDLRRSFSTHHYDKGVSVNLIMKIAGHTKESTFFEYIGKNPKKDFDAYNLLNAIKWKVVSPSKHEKLLDTLPKEFNRKEAIDLAKKIGISERSADGYLKKLTDESLIKKLNHGVYKKWLRSLKSHLIKT